MEYNVLLHDWFNKRCDKYCSLSTNVHIRYPLVLLKMYEHFAYNSLLVIYVVATRMCDVMLLQLDSGLGT